MTTLVTIQNQPAVAPKGTSCGKKVSAFGHNFLKGAVFIRDNTGPLSNFLRFAEHVGKGAEYLAGKKAFFTNLQVNVQSANLLDSLCLGEIFYWAGGKYKNDKPVRIMANVCGTAVGVMCVPLLLQDLGFIKLSQIADSIGRKVKAFSFVTKISLVTVLRSLLSLGHILFGIDAGMRLANAKRGTYEQKKAMIDIAYHVVSIAFYTIAAAGISAVLPLVILGTIAYGLGVTTAVYGELAGPKGKGLPNPSQDKRFDRLLGDYQPVAKAKVN